MKTSDQNYESIRVLFVLFGCLARNCVYANAAFKSNGKEGESSSQTVIIHNVSTWWRWFVCFIWWTVSRFCEIESDLLTSSESGDDIFLFSLIDSLSTIDVIANNCQVSALKLLTGVVQPVQLSLRPRTCQTSVHVKTSVHLASLWDFV